MPLDDLNEIKVELRDLVLSGKKDQAVRLLEDRFDVSPTEAERLLGLALKETINPANFIVGALGRAVGNKKSIFRMAAFAMGFIGIPMVLSAIGVYLYTNYQIDSSVRTTGVVTAVDPYRQTPTISYGVAGAEYTTTAAVFSDKPEFTIGDSVTLYVSQTDPQSVIIDTFAQRWLMVVVVGMIGFSFVSSMIVLLFHSRKF